MQDINLYLLVKFYAKKWAWILLITVIGFTGGFVYNNYIQTPLYKSSATLLLVSPEEKRSIQDVTLINNYIQLFKSRRVLEPVISEQNLNIDYDTLVKSIVATNEKNTEVIKVAISTPNPQVSRALVEGSVASFKTQAAELYNLDNVKLVDAASYPGQPYNVAKKSVLAASAFGGFVVAMLGLFFVYDYSLTHKPAAKKAKIAKAKSTNKKRKFAWFQKFAGVFRRKKTPPRKKDIAVNSKPKTTTESTPTKTKKSSVKKTTKQSRKGN